uniref:TEA domain-containing protein n=1 Tax=Panagrolaimus superbus TaxID=310955 RepID=A0A914YX09_9BILA
MDYNVTEQHHDPDVDMRESDQENEQNLTNEHENVVTSELETSIASHGTETVSPEREYHFGHDKLHGGRMWIQAFNDPIKYNLLSLYNKNGNEEIYKCIQCTRYEHRGHKPSTIIVRHSSDGKIELSESRNHYPSCSHDKAFIDKIQKKYHRTPRTPSYALPKAKTPLQRTGAPGPTLQRQAFHNVSSEEKPNRRRSARLSQNEIDVKFDTHADTPTAASFASRSIFIQPSSAAPSSARQRSRTQAVSRATPQNRIGRNDSVASNFSHLFPTFRQNVNSLQVLRPNVVYPRKSPDIVFSGPMNSASNSASSSSKFQMLTPSLDHQISTPLQNQSPNTKPIALKGMEPKILAANESICHCIPSTHTLREISALLGLEFETRNQRFWQSSFIVNEINGRSKASITPNISMGRNLGFQGISMFLTASEENTFKIQETIKRYIFKNILSPDGKKDESFTNAVEVALCSFQLHNIHLWVFSKMVKIRIVVFNGEKVEVYGDVFDDSLPSILLKKQNGEYLPVLSIKND